MVNPTDPRISPRPGSLDSRQDDTGPVSQETPIGTEPAGPSAPPEWQGVSRYDRGAGAFGSVGEYVLGTGTGYVTGAGNLVLDAANLVNMGVNGLLGLTPIDYRFRTNMRIEPTSRPEAAAQDAVQIASLVTGAAGAVKSAPAIARTLDDVIQIVRRPGLGRTEARVPPVSAASEPAPPMRLPDASRPAAPVLSGRSLDEAAERVLNLREGFIDGAVTRRDFLAGFESLPLDSRIMDRLRTLDERQLSSISGHARELLRIGSSRDPELISYLDRLIGAESRYELAGNFAHALRGAERLRELPLVTDVRNVTNGSGGLGLHFEGTLSGRPVIFKADRNLSLSAEGEERVYRALESYGGPRVYGRVRVQDPDGGLWREAVAMERIEGMDLQSLLWRQQAGQPLPFPITQTHVEAAQRLASRLAQEGRSLREVNFGDFILTPDPQRPLVPIDMMIDAARSGDVMSGMVGPNGPVLSAIQRLAGR